MAYYRQRCQHKTLVTFEGDANEKKKQSQAWKAVGLSFNCITQGRTILPDPKVAAPQNLFLLAGGFLILSYLFVIKEMFQNI